MFTVYVVFSVYVLSISSAHTVKSALRGHLRDKEKVVI